MSDKSITNQDDQELIQVSDATDELIDELMDAPATGSDGAEGDDKIPVEDGTEIVAEDEVEIEAEDEVGSEAGGDAVSPADVSTAETLDEIADVLLDEAKSADGNGEKHGRHARGEDAVPVFPVIGGSQGERDADEHGRGRNEDSDEDLVSMPASASVITHGTVMRGDAAGATDNGRLSEDRYKVSLGAMFACLFVGLALGILATFLYMHAAARLSAPEDDKMTSLPAHVSKDGLDREMVWYEYDGESHVLTVREVIELTGSLESMHDDDGYAVPSSEKAMEAVRNAVVFAEAERHGIAVTEGDVLDYVADTYGVPTVDELAQQVDIDASEAQRQLHDRLVVKKLKDEVVGSKGLVPLTEPPAPDNGDPAAYDTRYAEYIKSLAGDEWNSESGSWVNPEGAFAQAFGDVWFDGNEASYDMAKIAYDVVSARNEEIYEGVNQAWSDYINNLFRKVLVTIATISR